MTYKVKQMGKKKTFLVNKCRLKRCYLNEILKGNEIVEGSHMDVSVQEENVQGNAQVSA